MAQERDNEKIADKKPVSNHDTREGEKTVSNHDTREGEKTVSNHDTREGEKTVSTHDTREGEKTVSAHDTREGEKTVSNHDTREGEKTDPFQVILGILIFIFLLQTLIFIFKDTSPPYSDSVRHIRISWRYWQFFHSSGGGIPAFFPTDPFPPVMYLVSQFFYIVLGFSEITARVSMFFFIVILILSMYGIGCELGNKTSGLAVASLAMASPWIINFSRRYFIDFPECAMSALIFYLILKSDFYKNRLFSILLGVALGLGILTKWSCLFFIALPLIWFLIPNMIKSKKNIIYGTVGGIFILFLLWRIYSLLAHPPVRQDFGILLLYHYIPNFVLPVGILIWLRFCLRLGMEKEASSPKPKGIWDILFSPRRNEEEAIINFILAISLSILIATPWMIYSAGDINQKMFHDVGEQKIFSVSSSSYIRILLSGFSFCPLLMMTGTAMIFVYKEDLYKRLILPVSLIFSYFFMSINTMPSARYVLSWIIFSSALGGYWIYKTKKWEKPLLAVFIFLSIFAMWGWLWITPGQGLSLTVTVDVPNEKWLVLFAKPLNSAPPPEKAYDISPAVNYIKHYGSYSNMAYIDVTQGRRSDTHIQAEYVELQAISSGLNVTIREIFYHDLDKTDLSRDKCYILLYKKYNRDDFLALQKTMERISMSQYEPVSDDRAFDTGGEFALRIITYGGYSDNNLGESFKDFFPPRKSIDHDQPQKTKGWLYK